MNWSDLDFRPSSTKLRQFAQLGLVVFAGAAALQVYRGRTTIAIVLAAIAVMALAGIIRPSLARPLFVGLSVITFPIGWLVSHLVLAAVYFGLFTPIAILFRIIGRDPLRRRRENVESYWLPKSTPRDPRMYFRQF